MSAARSTDSGAEIGPKLTDGLRAEQRNLLSALDFDPLGIDYGLGSQLLFNAHRSVRASSTMCLASTRPCSTRCAWYWSAAANH